MEIDRPARLLLLVVAAAHGEITRGPYVQMPDNNVTLVWRTSEPATSVVDFGLTRDCDAGHIAQTNTTTEHVVVLPGLRAGTNYFYRVAGEIHALQTRRPAEQAFRFAVIGDFGTIATGAAKVAHQVNAAPIDFLLTVGDNVYPGGEREKYDPHWFKPYAPTLSRVACFPALGNHDVVTENGQPFVDFFHLPENSPTGLLERNYSFDFGNAHFVAVDSNPFAKDDKATTTKITDWVKRDLMATKQPWKFVYFHHPAYTSLSHHDETPAIKKLLVPVFEAAGVQMVFNGHNHFYERIKPQHGFVEIITGGGGMSLHPVITRRQYSEKLVGDRHSFTLVEITGPTLELRQIDEEGKTLDEFKLTR